MSIGDHQLNACPSSETLSAWLDGRLPANTKEAKHIELCPVCRLKLESFRRIDEGLLRYLQSNEPKLSPEATARSIRLKLKRQSKPFISRHWIPLAASFAICLTALTAALQIMPSAPILSEQTDHAKMVTAAKETVQPHEPSSRAELNEYRTIPKSQAVHIPDLNPVSFGQSDFRANVNAVLNPAPKEPIAAVIENKVNHVWVVKDSGLAADFMAIARQKLPLSNVGFKEKDRSFSFTAKGYAKEIVELVQRFNAGGGELLSKEDPQPEQFHFVNAPDDPVTYSAEIFY